MSGARDHEDDERHKHHVHHGCDVDRLEIEIDAARGLPIEGQWHRSPAIYPRNIKVLRNFSTQFLLRCRRAP